MESVPKAVAITADELVGVRDGVKENALPCATAERIETSASSINCLVDDNVKASDSVTSPIVECNPDRLLSSEKADSSAFSDVTKCTKDAEIVVIAQPMAYADNKQTRASVIVSPVQHDVTFVVNQLLQQVENVIAADVTVTNSIPVSLPRKNEKKGKDKGSRQSLAADGGLLDEDSKKPPKKKYQIAGLFSDTYKGVTSLEGEENSVAEVAEDEEEEEKAKEGP